MTLGPIPYTQGLQPLTRPALPGQDSGVLTLLIGAFLILTYYARHYSTFFKTFASDLLSIRPREKTFSVRTFSETGLQSAVIILTCLWEGILVNTLLTAFGHAHPSSFPVIGILTAMAAAYYLFQLGAYRTVGAVFTDKASARMWLKGFNSSQALAGMLLTVPALIALFNPGTFPIILPLAATFYVFARILFIYKGFRLFYDNIGSIVYFILYLCTLEIVPIVLLYRATLTIQEILLKL